MKVMGCSGVALGMALSFLLVGGVYDLSGLAAPTSEAIFSVLLR